MQKRKLHPPNVGGHGDGLEVNNLWGNKLRSAQHAVLVPGRVHFLAEAKVADLDLISGRIHHQDIIRLGGRNKNRSFKRGKFDGKVRNTDETKTPTLISRCKMFKL